DLERLRDEVVGAGANGRDRRVHVAERRDHDDGHVGAVRGDALAERDAVHPAHVEVGDDDVEVFDLEELEGLVGGVPPLDLEPSPAERLFEQLAHRSVVIHDENVAAHARSLLEGKYSAKRLPLPASLSTSMKPPCSCMMP